LIDRSEAIFRNVVKLLAKASTMALSSVDGFLRPFKKNETLQPDTKFKLEIEFVELSASDKALWSFRFIRFLLLFLPPHALLASSRAAVSPNAPVFC
jgi:hypothetical protein